MNNPGMLTFVTSEEIILAAKRKFKVAPAVALVIAAGLDTKIR